MVNVEADLEVNGAHMLRRLATATRRGQQNGVGNGIQEHHHVGGSLTGNVLARAAMGGDSARAKERWRHAQATKFSLISSRFLSFLPESHSSAIQSVLDRLPFL